MDVELGKVLVEGKTKKVHDLPNEPGCCLITSKDRITAGDGARAHDMAGKAEISTDTFTKIYTYLTACGIKTHFIRRCSVNSFMARKCWMIPIEFVSRRRATGSFLRRNPAVLEGYCFTPLKIEYFYKDDVNHDPQWSYEQLVSAGIECGSRVLSSNDIDVITRTTRTVFEILERAWRSLGCQLIDMKIEFGVDVDTGEGERSNFEVDGGEILLADVIDSDSWRLWPQGDKRLMLDKQVYRDMKDVTSSGLDLVKENFRSVSERLDGLAPSVTSKAIILMGSPSDEAFCRNIQEALKCLGVPSECRITSAHKNTEETLCILAEYEGRSNGLGPVLSANTCLPVINCPPLSPEWGREDVWSSLRMPSGLGCATVTSPDAAAQLAAQILGLHDHTLWAKLRVRALNSYIGLKRADERIRSRTGNLIV